ncbi:MAG TPA: Ig-like domain-containing protein [Enhygromyxa sp.]|nr:Ig-like domain-containing protein [Enhygromyxa sp.]
MPTTRQLLISSALLSPVACFSEVPPGSDTDTSTSGPESESDEDPSTDETDDETDSPTTDESETETGDEPDTTPPSIVSVSPEDAATGVGSDVNVVITFSEPMDRVSTQAAWQSADITGVVMQWNANDTELTIVPNEPLAYGMGATYETTQALEYAFTIDVTAEDLAGNTLEAPVSSSFFTWRHVVMQIAPVDEMTGMAYQPGSNINASQVYAGDVQGDTQQKGVLTFELPALPPTLEAIVSAELSAEQTTVSGSPYGPLPGLGEIHLLDVVFMLGSQAFDAPAISDLGVFSDNPTLEIKSHDVTAAVVDDHAQGRANTQFRLEFPIPTNGNGEVDRVTLSKPTVSLELGYLAE